MQSGSKVKYVDGAGEEHRATVHEVTGTGDSLYKVVSLVHGSGEKAQLAEGVVHENDAEKSDDGEAVPPFWREAGAAHRQEQAAIEPVPGGGVPSGQPALPVPPILPEPDEEPQAEPRARRGKK
jgi:hypothetical protein